MKVKIDIDCTPAEARAFLGLPDVAPLQDAVMGDVRERLLKTMATMDPETLLKTWIPGGTQALEEMQKAFWQQFIGGGRKGSG